MPPTVSLYYVDTVTRIASSGTQSYILCLRGYGYKVAGGRSTRVCGSCEARAYLCWDAVSLFRCICSSETSSDTVNTKDGNIACTSFPNAVVHLGHTDASPSRKATGAEWSLSQSSSFSFGSQPMLNRTAFPHRQRADLSLITLPLHAPEFVAFSLIAD